MRKTIQFSVLVLTFLLSLILAGCSNLAADPTPTPGPVSQDNFIPFINATGKVEPDAWANLSMSSTGVITSITVEEGQSVQEGDILVQLEGAETLQAAISTTQLELTSAEIALNEIQDQDYPLLAAQARQKMEAAQDDLEDLQNLDLQQALAQQAIAEAEKAVNDAEREVYRVQTSAGPADIDAAKAQVILAADALDNAREDYEPWENKPENNLTRANLLARFSAAQQAYDDAVRRLNALEGTGSLLDQAIARARLETAKAELSRAVRDAEKLEEGPDPVEIDLLEAQITNAENDWLSYLEGPDPDQITLAEARLANAEAQLKAALAALDNLTLIAPFDGVVSDIRVNSNEWIVPGQTVIILADLGHLVVKTTDLNEIDVAQVQPGSKAIISFDALPNQTIEATVVHIAPKSSEGAGVNYEVSLELVEIPTELRWGMTAFVDIEIE